MSRFLITLFLPLLLSPKALSQPESTRVSLEDAKKYAVDHNFEITALRRELDETKAKARRAKAPFFPKIGVAGGADTEMASKGTEAAVIGYAYGNFNIFNGFEDSYSSQIANLDAEKAEIRLRQAEFRVGLDIEKEFHGYLYKKNALGLKKEALKLNGEHKGTARKRRASGLAADSDIIEFDLRESILQSDLSSLEQELEESRVNLKRLLGEEIGSKIEPVGMLQHQHIKGNLMDYVTRIKNESESVTVAAKDLAITTIESKRWLAKSLPKIDLETRAGYLPLDNRPKEGGAAIQGLLLGKIELFSGFDTLWERRETEAKRLKLENQLKQALLTAVSQMEVAYRKIKATEYRVHLEEQNEARAKKYYQSVMSEYRRGVKNSSDVKNASEGMFDAALRQESFKLDFLVQRIDLEKALGGSVTVEVMKGKAGHD